MTDYLRQQLQSYLTVISTLMTVRYMAHASLFLTTVSSVRWWQSDTWLMSVCSWLQCHQYADDSQIHGSCQSVLDYSVTVSWQHRLLVRSNRLQLNTDKTEVM